MSTLEVNKITPAGAGTTVTLGDSGDSIDITSGATVTNFKSTGIDDNADATAITIDSSENVGIGTTSPTFSAGTGLHLNSSGNDCRFHITNSVTGTGTGDGSYIFQGSNSDFGILQAENASMKLYTNASQRMEINNLGLVGIGTSSISNYQLSVSGNPVGAFIETTSTSGGHESLIVKRPNAGTAVAFLNPSQVGQIFLNASSTSYNTTSDYRLKENVVDMTGATTRLKQLSPKRFNFIADADTTVDGFLAHEVSDIVPEAITGTHNEVDEEGNPVYQGIDQSKLVPLLTASLKEAIAKIETLETEMTALKARVTTLENA